MVYQNTYLDDLVDLPDTLHHMLEDLFGSQNLETVVLLFFLTRTVTTYTSLAALVSLPTGHYGINQLHITETSTP
ncbi:hypothetical protein GOODEAATRI_025268 [Goodea atripinnis]|uniref:Uncharacterized protein n=1 Tax=Goodea atripinnis TaxID=208336 RepID=A0ABV0PRV5_9TELE